jgi:hypothetical protein
LLGRIAQLRSKCSSLQDTISQDFDAARVGNWRSICLTREAKRLQVWLAGISDRVLAVQSVAWLAVGAVQWSGVGWASMQADF